MNLKHQFPLTIPAFITAALLMSGISMADQVATGIVFEDRNSNGQRDNDEPGLAGIAVSNGIDVVETDADGRYEIPVTDDTIIFITKPPTHTVATNEFGIPRFYYIHKPNGSPIYYYPGVAPTGPLPESIDFALIPQDVNSSFKIVAMADTQPQTEQEVAYLRRTIFTELVGSDALFAVNLGDIMFDNLEHFEPYLQAIGATGMTFHHAIGNHDMNFDAPDNSTKGETYQRYFGPLNYSWQEGDVHFVSFDNIYWRGRLADRFVTNHYYSEMIQENLDWLRRDLERVDPDKLVVICMHAPLYAVRNRNPYIRNLEAFFDVIADRERVVTISGHTHTNFIRHFSPEDGWNGPGELVDINSVVASGSWWSGPSDHRGIPFSIQRDGTPAGYTILEFNGNDYTIHFKGTERPADEQIRVYPPAGHQNGDNPRRTILANVFYGTPDTTVEFRMNGGEWQAMEFTPQRDPLGNQLFQGPADMGKPWVNPVISHHIWQADLDANPPGGTNRWEVRATLPDGRVFTSAALQ